MKQKKIRNVFGNLMDDVVLGFDRMAEEIGKGFDNIGWDSQSDDEDYEDYYSSDQDEVEQDDDSKKD